MRVKPLQDWAVIIPSEASVRTAGGIIIPDTAREKPAEGVVESIGPGALEEEGFGKKKKEQKDRKFIPTTVKPGERVLYESFAGHKLALGGREIVMVRERNILGVLPPMEKALHEELPPLQLPAVTTPSGTTALTKRESHPPLVVAEHLKAVSKQKRKTAAKKTAKKASKKSAKKAKKKTKKKPAAITVRKKTGIKKTKKKR